MFFHRQQQLKTNNDEFLTLMSVYNVTLLQCVTCSAIA